MNNSRNISAHRQLFDSTLSTTIDVAYITISVAGTVLNSLICLLFYKDKSLRKPFHILLLNLSLANMLSAFAIQPYVWIDFTKLGGNSAAGSLCAISVGLVFFLSTGLTTLLTLSAITVFRYLGIVRNYQGKLVTSKFIVASICVMTWVIGALSNIINGLSFQYNEYEAICYRKWPKEINVNLYTLLTTVLFALIPTLTTIICYIVLAIHVWKRSFEAHEQNIAAVRARKRVTLLVGLLILALTICWYPLMLVWILGKAFSYFPEGPDGEYKRQRLLRVTTILALFNSVLDPFIYIFSCPEYRKSITKFIFAKWRRKVSSSSGSYRVDFIGVAREFRHRGARSTFSTKGCGRGEISPDKGVAHITIDDQG